MKLLFLLILLIPFTVKGLEINSENALFINIDNKEILMEINSDERIKVASLTKIVTTITAIEHISNLDEKVILTSDMFMGLVEANASVAGFKVGEIVTYRDLLYGTMLESGADATQALAILISGSEEEYAKLMNETMYKLNLTNSNFTNSSGLDDEKAYSTLNDMAIVLMYALENDTFKTIYTSLEYESSNGLKLYSTMEYVGQRYGINYDIIEGSKSGYTPLAGYCLSSISSFNNYNYILLTAGADPYAGYPLNVVDAINIYNHYFDNYDYRQILDNEEVIMTLEIENKEDKVEIKSNEEIILYLDNNDKITYQYHGIETLNHEINQNEIIGKYQIFINDELYKTIDILNPIIIKNENYIIIIMIIIIIIIGGIIWKLKKLK